MALYTIQLSAARQHKKSLLKKADFKDVQSRVVIKYPEAKEIPEEMKMGCLPSLMVAFLADNSKTNNFKVEWMYKGGYKTAKSDVYSARYGTNKVARRDLYTKCVDTMGFGYWDAAYKMWIESIRSPGQIIKYEGMAYHLDTKKNELQTAKMMTLIIDYQHMITITTII